jgi:DNA/RNA-binding domain of Phe-tRNA-synthetase-like protein
MQPKHVRLRITEPVAARFPHVDIRVVTAVGFSNTTPWPVVDDAIASLEETGLGLSTVEEVEADVAVADWFAAYREFGTNPRRFRPSVYALLRRVLKDGQLPRINPAVNAYNLVSVRNRVPAGAFDLDKLVSDVEIRFGTREDRFVPLGEPDAEERPNDGEVVYAMGNQILTRHWNYRDSDLTKVDDSTVSAVFLLEGVSADASVRLETATFQLKQLLRDTAQHVEVVRMTADNPTVDLTA